MNNIVKLILSIGIATFGIDILAGEMKEEDLTMQKDPCTHSTLVYVKTGGGLEMDELPSLLLGLGVRARKKHHGIDLSISEMTSLEPFILASTVSIKGQYLFYFRPESNATFFVGGGGEYGYTEYNGILAALCPDSWFSPIHHLSMSGVCGYEFRRQEKVKPFVQLEASQPVKLLNNNESKLMGPSVIVSLGIGY